MTAAVLESRELPPHSEEAERAVLGALLLDPTEWDIVCEWIGENDFYIGIHRSIWRAIERVLHDEQPADPLTVAEALKANGELESVGGLAYLRELVNTTPSAANLGSYTNLVANYARRRRLLGDISELHAAVSAPKANIDEILTDALKKISRAASVTGSACVVQLIRGDTIAPESVNWLWDGYLALKKLHIIGGAPGTGKTTLALGMAAAITCGGRWPDGTRATVGDVLIWSGEDSIEDTLAPRLIAAGADMARVHFVGSLTGRAPKRPFDPATDFPALEVEAARIPNLRFLMLDPVVMAVAGDSHKNAETRRGLQPVVDFAAVSGCAVVGITHFSKGSKGRNPLERVIGSVAFGAMPRVVLVTVKQSEAEGGARLLVRAKSNIGPDGGGFRYELRLVELQGEHAGIIVTRPEYTGTVDGDALEILDAAEAQADPEQRTALTEAEAFLRQVLADGPVPQKRIQADARGAGISERTLYRAKSKLKIEAKKRGLTGGWDWCPPPEGCQKPYTKNVAAFDTFEGCQTNDKTAEGCQKTPKAANKRSGEFGNLQEEADEYRRVSGGE